MSGAYENNKHTNYTKIEVIDQIVLENQLISSNGGAPLSSMINCKFAKKSYDKRGSHHI